MGKIRLKDKEFELFIPEQRIMEAVERMAGQIEKDIEGQNPLFVGILNGAFIFAAELMKCLNGPHEITFARYSSYEGISTTGKIKEITPIRADYEGRTVILLEDIIDTGLTMQYVKNKLMRRGAGEVKLATLLYKPDSLICDLTPDYIGLEIPSVFIVGHGLDYDKLGRSYKDIYKLVDKS